MPNQKKISIVQNLTEKFRQTKALVLADYSGLNVSRINELRSEVKKAGGDFEVVKNTLIRLAAKETKHPVSETELKGPLAALWCYSEDTAPLKAFKNFIQKTDLPKIKFGFWENQLISTERVMELANLANRTELTAKLVGLVQSPSFNLVKALNWNLLKLLLTIKAAGKKPDVGKDGGD